MTEHVPVPVLIHLCLDARLQVEHFSFQTNTALTFIGPLLKIVFIPHEERYRIGFRSHARHVLAVVFDCKVGAEVFVPEPVVLCA